ncbi:MAG TPA: penicillin-binding protein, partial [Roseiarcus sp.]
MFGRGAKKTRKRIEPRLNWRGESASDDLRADPADRPPTSRRTRKSASRGAARTSRRRRSWLGRLVYWGSVLTVWGLISTVALVTYYASQLPPIDQLAVPKRPPNIAILAEDGSL